MVAFRPAKNHAVVWANAYFVRHAVLNNVRNAEDVRAFF